MDQVDLVIIHSGIGFSHGDLDCDKQQKTIDVNFLKYLSYWFLYKNRLDRSISRNKKKRFDAFPESIKSCLQVKVTLF